MKKLLTFICVITCVLGLSACGKETTYTEYEQQKLTNAESIALEGYIPILSEFLDDEMQTQNSEYTAEELEYIFEQYYGLIIDGNGFKSAADSFNLNGKNIGTISIDENVEIESKIDGKQIIMSIPVNGEKKNAKIEMILSNDMFLKLESASLTPDSTFGESMGKAGLNTLIGMTTVFCVLIGISLIIALFGFIPKIQKALAKKEEKPTGIDNAVAQITKQEEVIEESDDTELVAVIAAAIAAYEGSGNASGYVVRSIRRRY